VLQGKKCKIPIAGKRRFCNFVSGEKGQKEKNGSKDKEIVKLILSQLEHDWRKGLVEKLKQLAKKYSVK
jgi:hypothetical protein